MSFQKDPAYPPAGNEKQSGQYPNMATTAPMAPYPPPAYNYAPPPYSSQPPMMPGPGSYQYQTQYQYPPAGVQHQSYSGSGHMMAQGPPPPYSAYQQSYSAVQTGYPTQPGYAYSNQNVTAVAHFDSGARFDGVASHNIPPPPPGCAPNAAQMAAAQGGTVIATQKNAGWLSGGSGGGITFW
ncbi:DAZ-associated protein 2-like [Physella acuta]|uniref:DAZ-associated protein 2-like n=1 Tax=Physella acuta TaxID=109671 RepID=UPI0027DDD9E7|nr:DAZ-associated protein 2-like [Physella acuta]